MKTVFVNGINPFKLAASMGFRPSVLVYRPLNHEPPTQSKVRVGRVKLMAYIAENPRSTPRMAAEHFEARAITIRNQMAALEELGWFTREKVLEGSEYVYAYTRAERKLT